MEFFKKLMTQLTGAANDGLDAVSDNSRAVRQNVREMQADIERAKVAVADVNAQKTLVQNRIVEAKAAAADWGIRAERAIKLNDDELASAALEQQVIEEGRIAKYTEQLNDLAPQAQKLNDLLKQRQEQLESAKIDSDVIQAEDKIANATMSAAKSLAPSGAAGALASAKTAIKEKAAKADALLDLSEDKGDALDRKLRNLETNSNVADRLAALKAKAAQ